MITASRITWTWVFWMGWRVGLTLRVPHPTGAQLLDALREGRHLTTTLRAFGGDAPCA